MALEKGWGFSTPVFLVAEYERETVDLRRWNIGTLRGALLAALSVLLASLYVCPSIAIAQDSKKQSAISSEALIKSPQKTTADPEVPNPDDTDWPAYNREPNGQRFAPLDEINEKNVSRLTEICRVHVSAGGAFQSGPLVVHGILYVTGRFVTEAIDATNCDVQWKNVYEPEQKEALVANRGAAFENEVIFRGTTDGRVFALHAASGNQLWRVAPADPTIGESFTSAPLAWNGLVFIGIAGGDFGIKGRVFAFDAKTGATVWTFNTVPQGDEFGVKTWARGSEQTGGGGTWSSYALDPERGELFVPIGNPAPIFNHDYRAGDNLFTDSLVVLDARSGKLKWWYQIAANDDHDWDLSAPPMLFEDKKRSRKLVAFASKGGYVYVVDRDTHALRYKTAVTTISNERLPLTESATRVCPGIAGGIQWNGAAYDPTLNTIVVGSVDFCSLLRVAPAHYEAGSVFWGGSWEMKDDEVRVGWITAIDASSGAIRWKYQTPAPVVAAVTPTSGGITFAGDIAGNFYIFKTSDGALLRRIETGGALAGGIVTYTVNKKQYVAITSGNVSRSVWGAVGVPSIVIYALN